MAGCAHCGGCCVHCATTCGMMGGGLGGGLGGGFGGGFGGVGFGGYGSFGGFGFHPWFGSLRHHDEADEATTAVDTEALADPEHPGHRDAVKAVSHIDPEEHSKLIEWLKKELAQIEPK